MRTSPLLLLSLFLALSCTPKTPTPTETSSAPVKALHVEAVPVKPEPASPLPSTPVFRLLDSAADQELKAAFGIDQAQRDAAKAKYGTQRWRFRAKVGDKTGNFAVLIPEGIPQLSVHFRTEAECEKLTRGETYLFEATVDDWLSRHLVDAISVPNE